MEKYVSNVITQEALDSIQPGQFNVLAAPCGSGKTTFMFDDRILNFARAKKHVLYLIHNKVTRDFIAREHSDKACVFNDCNCSGWFDSRKHPGRRLWSTDCEENRDEDLVHVMCYQTFAALLRNEGIDWLDDIDLIVWDEFDDFRGYYEAEVKTSKRIFPNFSREMLIALLQKGKTTSVVNFIYQLKEVVLKPGKIRLIAISASPEIAALYFQDYLSYIYTGKLEYVNDAKTIFFIDNIKTALYNGELPHEEGRRYWCFTKYISEGREIEAAARDAGFSVILLWSETNSDYRSLYTDEKRRVTHAIRDDHIVPSKYDFIITTGVLARGIDIYDTSIQDWICNSIDYEDVVQFNRARFSPERQYLLTPARGLVNFIREGFNAAYYEWHTKEEWQKTLNTYPVFKQDALGERILTLANFKKEYPDLLEKRQYGRSRVTQYRLKAQAAESTEKANDVTLEKDAS